MRSQTSRGPVRSLARVCARTGAVIALGAIAFACGREESPPPAATPETPPAAETPAVPAPTPSPAPADETPPSPEAVGGTATEGVIPEGYPSDIPVYPGADPGPAMAMPGGVFVTFESDDTVEAILAHYRAELANNGWTVQDSPDGTGVDGTKDGRSVQVRARTAESGRSEIAVSVGS